MKENTATNLGPRMFDSLYMELNGGLLRIGKLFGWTGPWAVRER